jgi:hypothetical protein
MDKVDTTPYIASLVECQQDDDTEVAHCDADDVLCDLLTRLGYDDVVEAYCKVEKWFA